jgi:hypothetical protein
MILFKDIISVYNSDYLIVDILNNYSGEYDNEIIISDEEEFVEAIKNIFKVDNLKDILSILN